MVVRHTLLHLDPERLEEAREFYNGEDLTGVLRTLKGYRFNHLLESVDEPGEAVSVTAWDTMEDAEAYEQSGLYADLVTTLASGPLLPPNSGRTRCASNIYATREEQW